MAFLELIGTILIRTSEEILQNGKCPVGSLRTQPGILLTHTLLHSHIAHYTVVALNQVYYSPTQSRGTPDQVPSSKHSIELSPPFSMGYFFLHSYDIILPIFLLNPLGFTVSSLGTSGHFVGFGGSGSLSVSKWLII